MPQQSPDKSSPRSIFHLNSSIEGEWFKGLAEKDLLGDRAHLILGMLLLATLPLNAAISGVLFGMLVVWYLVRLYFWKPYMYSGPMKILLPGVLWIAFLALSLLWTTDVELGFREVWANRWIMLVPLLWPIMTRWRLLLTSILVGSVIQGTYQIIEALVYMDPFQIQGLNDHPRPVAAWMAASTAGIIVLYISGFLKRWFWLLPVYVFTLANFLTASRGAVVATAICLIVVISIMLYQRKIYFRNLRILAINLIPMVIILASFGQHIQPYFVQSYTAIKAMSNGEEIIDIRFLWWRACLRQWTNHPLIGYGIGGTAYALSTDEQLFEEGSVLPEQERKGLVFNQPHSTYFQVLLEGGIIGILLLAFLLVSFVVMCMRTARLHPLGILGLAVVIIWLITAGFDSWHTQGQTLALLWVGALFGSLHILFGHGGSFDCQVHNSDSPKDDIQTSEGKSTCVATE